MNCLLEALPVLLQKGDKCWTGQCSCLAVCIPVTSHAPPQLGLCHAEMTTSDEDTQVNLFCAFLEDQDRGFEGTFADWTKTVLGDREEAYPLLDWFELEVPDEEVSLSSFDGTMNWCLLPLSGLFCPIHLLCKRTGKMKHQRNIR